MRFFPDLRPKTRHTLSVDLTAENRETDALPKTGEAGAEHASKAYSVYFCLFQEEQQLALKEDVVKFTSNLLRLSRH